METCFFGQGKTPQGEKKRTLTVLFVSLSSPRTCWPAEAIAAKPAGTQTVFRRLSVSYSVLSPLAVQFLPDCPGQQFLSLLGPQHLQHGGTHHLLEGFVVQMPFESVEVKR